MLHKPVMKGFYWSLRIAGALLRRGGIVVSTSVHRAVLQSVGRGTQFQAGVRFAQPAQVSIGENCYFWRGCHVSADVPDAPLVIADRVQINRAVHLDTTGGLTIGNDVVISEQAVLYTHDHGHDPHAAPELLPKTVADGVWIGMAAVILPQCRRIGRGAIIGAGAIVAHDVPPGAVVVGNPGRVVRQRDLLTPVAA